MTKESTKSKPLTVGDYVIIGKGKNSQLGLITGIKQFYSGRQFGGVIHPTARRNIENNPNPRVFEVRLGKYKSDQFFEEECDRLTEKELFKGKLSGKFDKIFE
jgi:hypothetical protein